MSTNLPESRVNNQTAMPPLAQYRSRNEYKPNYGDYFVWSRWFSTWHGLIVNYDKTTDELYIIMAGLPFLLFTMPDSDYEKETVRIKLSDIKRAPNGKYAIQHHDQTQNAVIWYI